ncbi:MAG: hypothetical protein ABWY55_09335 [Microbacterium sp.]
MSTEDGTRRPRTHRRRGRAFVGAFAIVSAALLVVGLSAAAAGVAQGPRVTRVQVDPATAVAASGSRLIVTTSQALADVDASQVSVDPEVPFSADTSGRSVGVRFGMPLRDDTEYTVTIEDVQGLGGGPGATIVETFRTPPIEVHMLQRGGPDGDMIFRTDLTGQRAVPVFTHPHIEDFRATAAHLVASVRTDDDEASLIVTDLSGGAQRGLPLPGDGFVSNLQASDRGEMIGYTFSDADLDETGGLESVLFTASLKDDAKDAEPTVIEVTGADSRIADWRFVPDTDSILMLTFDGALLLTGSDGGGATTLGTAIAIDGVAGTEAIVERADGMVVVDLATGADEPLVEPDADLGALGKVVPVPGGGTLRTYAELDERGLPASVSVVMVDHDGTPRNVADLAPGDALLQTCVAPSGRYAAMLVAPDAVANPYDSYLLPVPERLETRIVELADGSPVVSLTGFDISWCRVPPS